MGLKTDQIELLPPKRKGGKWYFHRRSRNGQIADASQGYSRKDGAKRGAQRNFPHLPVVVRGRAA